MFKSLLIFSGYRLLRSSEMPVLIGM